MASPRVRKIADRIKVVVAEMLERRVKDPRLGFVTVPDEATDVEVVVSDNASTDGTPELVRRLAARDGRVTLVASTENDGYAAGINRGVAAASAPVVVLANNDLLLRQLDDVARRLIAAQRRARSRNARRGWSLDPPRWWTPTETVAQRRALADGERKRYLRYRRAA